MPQLQTTFIKLNGGWNAEPNAPEPRVWRDGDTLILSFYLNPWAFDGVSRGDCGEVTFLHSRRYRLGATNDEGWWRGQCRFSMYAPEWGEFYELEGNLLLDKLPADAWTIIVGEPLKAPRHFLFYLRDETFECEASEWSFQVIASKSSPPPT